MFLLSVCPFSKPSTVRVGMLLFISQAMKADQACIVIFREKTAFRRYMICLFHVLDRLGSLKGQKKMFHWHNRIIFFFFFFLPFSEQIYELLLLTESKKSQSGRCNYLYLKKSIFLLFLIFMYNCFFIVKSIGSGQD